MSKSTTQKRLSIKEQIKQLQAQEKELLKIEKAEAEKKKRERFCNRGEMIEKLMPHLAALSEQEFEIYMKKLLSPPVLQNDILMKGEIDNDEE